jgi:flagellar hook-basal body complex protein FliE
MTIDALLAARAQILTQSGGIAAALAQPAHTHGFGTVFAQAMDGVAASQRTAADAAAAFERGDTNDIAAVQLARQTAAIDFQATLQVRNRVLSAYHDIMNMGV